MMMMMMMMMTTTMMMMMMVVVMMKCSHQLLQIKRSISDCRQFKGRRS